MGGTEGVDVGFWTSPWTSRAWRMGMLVESGWKLPSILEAAVIFLCINIYICLYLTVETSACSHKAHALLEWWTGRLLGKIIFRLFLDYFYEPNVGAVCFIICPPEFLLQQLVQPPPEWRSKQNHKSHQDTDTKPWLPSLYPCWAERSPARCLHLFYIHSKMGLQRSAGVIPCGYTKKK